MNKEQEKELYKELLAVREEVRQSFLKEVKEHPAVIYHYYPKLVKKTSLYSGRVNGA